MDKCVKGDTLLAKGAVFGVNVSSGLFRLYETTGGGCGEYRLLTTVHTDWLNELLGLLVQAMLKTQSK